MATLQNTRGVLGLVGPLIDGLALSAIRSAPDEAKPSLITTRPPYHITLFSKAELKSLSPSQITKTQPDITHIHSLGIGGSSKKEVYFVVIIWAAGQQARIQLGLPPKHFHITLTDHDDHDMDKGVHSLIPVSVNTPHLSPDLLDHLCFTLQTFKSYNDAQNYAVRLVIAEPDSHRGFLRLADAALRSDQFKLSMLSYARAFERAEQEEVRSYCVRKMTECSQHTEWGPVFFEDDISQLPAEITTILCSPWSQELLTAISDSNPIPTLQIEPRQTLYIPKHVNTNRPEYKLPRFFRWLIPFRLAVMSTPRHEDDITALASPWIGIRHVLTLTEEEPLSRRWFARKPITNTFLPIPNFNPPSIEQMDIVIRLLEDEQNFPLLIHCGGGKGRAGTVAACYLAAFGFEKPRFEITQPTMPAAEAISQLRHLRPGSLETSQQENFVSKWCSTLWKRQSLYPDRPSEPAPCALEIEGSFVPREGDLFVLVGLPGSGKSYFSNSLLARDPKGWTRISQDDTGSRAMCEAEIGRPPGGGGRMLLDRCNTAAVDRAGWLELAATWAKAPVCVWFDFDRELCTSRAQMRTAHPTLPPGSRVRNAIEQMHKIFVQPSTKEGFKAVIRIRSFAAAQDLILRLSPSITIFKFPRTPHIINLGAATSDDVIDEALPIPSDSRVIITEKVDGANMGFSLSSDRSTIVVQNRSHYVDSSSHEQFKKLNLWVECHDADLRRVLDRDAFFPERYILFGEWMYATHSIPYTQLPDRFIAYDVYDRSTATWADRETLQALLLATTIASVPVLHEGEMPSHTELKKMVQMQSNFWDGRVEGVYVKVERGGLVVGRGKVVRADFIAGNEHWTKGNIRVNGLSREG